MIGNFANIQSSLEGCFYCQISNITILVYKLIINIKYLKALTWRMIGILMKNPKGAHFIHLIYYKFFFMTL